MPPEPNNDWISYDPIRAAGPNVIAQRFYPKPCDLAHRNVVPGARRFAELVLPCVLSGSSATRTLARNGRVGSVGASRSHGGVHRILSGATPAWRSSVRWPGHFSLKRGGIARRLANPFGWF